jgi:pilus assembly protein CpaB
VKRRVLTVALAVLLALIGIVAVLAYVHKANQRAIAGVKAVTALVASQSIPAGTSASAALSGGMLTRQRFPLSSVPSGYVSSVSPDISHLVTSSAMQTGQILTLPLLVRAGQVTGAGIAIPPGMAAVSVELCLEADVAGFVGPGSSVAVFDTYGRGSTDLQQACDPARQVRGGATAVTRVLLPKAEVLSVAAGPASSLSTAAGSGTVQVSASGSSAASQGAVLVTLAVTPDQAQRLILATLAGLPYLALLGTNTTVPANLVPFQSFK